MLSLAESKALLLYQVSFFLQQLVVTRLLYVQESHSCIWYLRWFVVIVLCLTGVTMGFCTVKWQWLLILHIVPLCMLMSRSRGISSDGTIYLPLLLNIDVEYVQALNQLRKCF